MIDSECHGMALQLFCELLQPDCRRGQTLSARGVFEDELVPPCKDFCEEVL